MPDYQKGKIYKIWDKDYQECYVGSTVQELSMRMVEHRKRYKAYKEGRRENSETNSYKIFDKYGLENCRIELEELYPCNSKMELVKREGFHIRNSICVNRQVAGRTQAEYYQENKEYVNERQKKYAEDRKEFYREYKKQYYEDNRENLIQQQKEYNEQNKDKIREQRKKYREDNDQKIKEQRKELYTCGCGCTLTKAKRSRHNKSNRHQQYLNQQEPAEEL